jgi:hypothetical protein
MPPDIMENRIVMKKFETIYKQPSTVGFWRPIEVEIGFIEDYINRSIIVSDGIIIL